MSWFKRLKGTYKPVTTDPPPAPPPARPKEDLGTAYLKPVSGKIYGYLFETNHHHVQIPLALFWNVQIECEPVPVTDRWSDVMEAESWPSSLAFDWLDWPVSNLSSIVGKNLKQQREPDRLETSIYLYGTHWTAKPKRLEVERGASQSLSAAFGAEAEIDLYNATQKLACEGQCDLEMKGIIVTPDNHFPKPNTPDLATAMLSKFIETDALEPSQNDRGQFVFMLRGSETAQTHE